MYIYTVYIYLCVCGHVVIIARALSSQRCASPVWVVGCLVVSKMRPENGRWISGGPLGIW